MNLILVSTARFWNNLSVRLHVKGLESQIILTSLGITYPIKAIVREIIVQK